MAKERLAELLVFAQPLERDACQYWTLHWGCCWCLFVHTWDGDQVNSQAPSAAFGPRESWPHLRQTSAHSSPGICESSLGNFSPPALTVWAEQLTLPWPEFGCQVRLQRIFSDLPWKQIVNLECWSGSCISVAHGGAFSAILLSPESSTLLEMQGSDPRPAEMSRGQHSN